MKLIRNNQADEQFPKVAHYDVELDKEYTVGEFIHMVAKDTNYDGSIVIECNGEHRGCTNYFRGAIGVIDESFVNARIHSATATKRADFEDGRADFTVQIVQEVLDGQ